MKTTIKVLKFSLTLFIFTNINAYSNDDLKAIDSFGEITLIEGNAHIIKNNKNIKIVRGFKLAKNDRIITNYGSKTEITLYDKSKIRLNQNSEVFLSSISSKKEKFTFLKVLKGQVWASIKNKGEGRFAIQSKKSLFAVMGTVFDVNINDKKKTEMSVFEGSVGVTKYTSDIALQKRIEDLQLTIDDNRNKPFTVHEVEKPFYRIDAPKEVSIEEWLEITKNQKITIDDQNKSYLSQIKNDDKWIKWNKNLDYKQNE